MADNATNVKYRELFKNAGLLDKVNTWLIDNPQPDEWRTGEFTWAFTEMPFDMDDLEKLNREYGKSIKPHWNYLHESTNSFSKTKRYWADSRTGDSRQHLCHAEEESGISPVRSPGRAVPELQIPSQKDSQRPQFLQMWIDWLRQLRGQWYPVEVRVQKVCEKGVNQLINNY